MGVGVAVRGIDDLTVAWCQAALAGGLGRGRVTGVEVATVGTGQVADTVRLQLTYDPPDAGPPTLVAKVPAAEEASRLAARMTRTYEIEASFYRDLAPTLAVRAPRCWAADHDAASDAYVVVLEDVAPAEPGEQVAGLTPAQAETAVDELALLHAGRWADRALESIGWLHRATPAATDGIVALVTGSAPVFVERLGERLSPDTIALVERLVPRLGAYLHGRPRPWTVVHGDYRADNLLFDGDRVVVVDWQTVVLGPPASDLSYLLGTSLPHDVRRAEEAVLVERYVDRARAAGAALTAGEMWPRYRRAAVSGLVMAIVASVLVRRTDRGDAMFCAMAERSATMVADLDAEALLTD